MSFMWAVGRIYHESDGLHVMYQGAAVNHLSC